MCRPLQLLPEIEMILAEECRGQSGESRERWGEVCTAILKQGELESGNNGRISEIFVNLMVSCAVICVCTICVCTSIHIIHVHVHNIVEIR